MWELLVRSIYYRSNNNWSWSKNYKCIQIIIIFNMIYLIFKVRIQIQIIWFNNTKHDFHLIFIRIETFYTDSSSFSRLVRTNLLTAFSWQPIFFYGIECFGHYQRPLIINNDGSFLYFHVFFHGGELSYYRGCVAKL